MNLNVQYILSNKTKILVLNKTVFSIYIVSKMEEDR